MIKKIEALFDKIRPALHYDGGDLELVKYDAKNKIVHIRFTGMCTHCAISEITLKHLIERELKKEIPSIREVIPVT